MRRLSKSQSTLFMAVAAVALAAIFCACPLGMMAHAQMSQMMGQDMPTQGMQGMCPMLCGLPPYSIGFESSDLDRGPLPVYLEPNPISTIRPIFHPPNLA